MNQSEQIGELAKALSIAQSHIDGAVKTKKGNFSKYATLTDVWDCIRIPLSSNNLCVVQTFEVLNEKNYIITTLLHSSGQWIRGSMLMPVVGPKAQDLMSSVTYCRRYTLCSLCGVAPLDEDDDGQKANDSMSAPKESRHIQKPTESQSAPIATKVAPRVDNSIRTLHKAVCGAGHLVGEDIVDNFLNALVEKYPNKNKQDLISSALVSKEQTDKFVNSFIEWREKS